MVINMIIETERLILRPWHEDDAEALYKYAKDPNVGPAAGWNVHRDVDDSREIIKTVLSEPETYAVVLKETGEPAGSIGAFFTNAEGAENEYEIGYWIGKPYWGRGLIPEAVRALQKRCFENFGSERIWCSYFDGNEKSERVQEKCGFKYHHTVYNVEWKITNELKTVHYTCLLKKDFERSEI